ncbi:alkaline shock response membrane anchor protein AmaP [Streptomyces sp. 5-8]|uniref:Alkaline shock response membrane anchor protein AmaP n=1 Tax=Streptomyces musisoli TaxID=2802280 RepID=A0ABS1PDB5_9ACTN|nr:alkaline shock response membrane anchor protein AmaP [Streptomyces musisoli]MBL1110368.1 alkaline shock response membrane anchor protein AmaP [Streptomyces musisoli]
MTPQPVLNRILLALIGLMLLGGGLLIIATGCDLHRRLGLTPPAGWPLTAPDDVLLSSADRTRWSSQGWWWPAVIAALVLIALLALWWLLAQLRRQRPSRVTVGTDHAQPGVELRHSALTDAIAAQAGSLPGFERAKVRLTGRPARLHAGITATLTPETTPETALKALDDGPLNDARQSTGHDDLIAETRLHIAHHKPHRVH